MSGIDYEDEMNEFIPELVQKRFKDIATTRNNFFKEKTKEEDEECYKKLEEIKL